MVGQWWCNTDAQQICETLRCGAVARALLRVVH